MSMSWQDHQHETNLAAYRNATECVECGAPFDGLTRATRKAQGPVTKGDFQAYCVPCAESGFGPTNADGDYFDPSYEPSTADLEELNGPQ